MIFCDSLAWAQSSAPVASALQASNVLNPNVSVIGWFQGESGQRKLGEGEEAPPAFQLKEAEIAFQSVVDPYARADFFVAVEPSEEKVDLEEGYLTWFNLPYDLALKVGKFKGNFGKFNRTHTPETAFSDRPIVHEKYFGEEGLSSMGGSLSWHVPNPWIFVDLNAEVLNMPKFSEVPAFDEARRKDLLYIGRLSGYYDLTESANFTLGTSYVHGSSGQEFDAISSSSKTLASQLYGLDITFRWKNPQRAIYRSFFWQTEAFWNKREISSLPSVKSFGLFTHLEYQFLRRWRVGGRYDWSESPSDDSQHEAGGLLYLTFAPSEFSLISVQGRQIKKPTGETENVGFLKITFNIGPHGAHPF
ncbi:MAG: hypothetical protein HY400_03905 [Elusimicrobia bacterium]|nr:hypothetical protein [Elusimicrobiota bacterium]